MKLRPVTSLIFCLFFGTVSAQTVPDNDGAAPAGTQNTEVQKADEIHALLGPEELPAQSIDVWDRIRAGFKIPDTESARVGSQLQLISRHPAQFARAAERAGLYLYYIVGEVEARKMPMELALLPFVESSFKPTALSSAKASGLWQFIPSTGTHFDLQQNLWKDERRDVIESTRAALDYFQVLYDMFHDWQLALAAYNWGEGNVQRAIRRNEQRGLPADYLHLQMPQETTNYVPRLEAVKKIIQSPQSYGITLPDIGSEPYFVQVFRDKDMDIKTAAKLAQMKLDDFKVLNPGFSKPVIVGAHDNAMLIPADNLDLFMENLARWRSNGKRTSAWRTHRFQKGEKLSDIAENSGMTLEELRSVNHIPDNRFVADNSLLLVRATDAHPREEIDGDSAFFRLEPVQSIPKIRYRQIRYRVRKGDTLAGIAERLNVTTRSIIVSNRLRSSKLRRGMSLSVTVPVVQRSASPAGTASPRARLMPKRYRLNANPAKTRAPSMARRASSKPAASSRTARKASAAKQPVKKTAPARAAAKKRR